jgi:hypothetical protein
MARISTLLFCACCFHALAQTDSLKAIEEINAFRKKINEEYKTSEKSPLESYEFAKLFLLSLNVDQG